MEQHLSTRSSRFCALFCLFWVAVFLQAEICLANDLSHYRKFGRGYRGGISGREIEFQADEVSISNGMLYLFSSSNSKPYKFRSDVNFKKVTVCFSSKAKFVCPQSDEGVKAASYADLVSRSGSKSYCCGPDSSQKCCTADQFSAKNSVDKNTDTSAGSTNANNASTINVNVDTNTNSNTNPSNVGPSDKKSDKSDGLSTAVIVGICVSSVVGVLFIGLMIFCICKYCCIDKKPRNAMTRPQQPYNQQPYNQQPYNQQPYSQQPYNQQPYSQQPYQRSPQYQQPQPYGGYSQPPPMTPPMQQQQQYQPPSPMPSPQQQQQQQQQQYPPPPRPM